MIVPANDPAMLAFNKDNKSSKAFDHLLTRDEFDRAESAFDEHFRIGGSAQIRYEWHSFLYSELEDLVSTVPGQHRLVVIHYGLEGDKLRYGFSIVEGTPVPGSGLAFSYTPSPDPTHILLETDFVEVDLGKWAALRQEYMDRVKVRRTAGPVFEDLLSTDALRVVIPWEDEIFLMFRETTNGIDDSFRVAVDSVSLEHPAQEHEGLASPAGFRHGVAIYVERKSFFGWNRMLDNDNHATIYKNRAADYGNLCPVRCNYYER